MSSVRLALLTLCTCLAAGVAQAEPGVLARYELRRAGRPPAPLELLRDADLVEHRYVESDTIRVWRRVGPDELEHLALSPGSGKGVRYTAGDLRAIVEEVEWSALGSLLSERERSTLTRVGTQRVGGRALPRLRGMLRGQPVRVTWLEDVQLPLELSLGTGREQVVLRLRAVKPCTAARCVPTATHDLTLLDFADLGDMTYDPFVRSYLSRQGRGHTH